MNLKSPYPFEIYPDRPKEGIKPLSRISEIKMTNGDDFVKVQVDQHVVDRAEDPQSFLQDIIFQMAERLRAKTN